MWYKRFNAQSYGQIILKHKSLPIYCTKEFDFYRCVEFKDIFYGKTISELFSGNLRYSEGRFSKLFPNQKISYWSESPKTARAEIKSHGAENNILTFHAYDDSSSSEPCLGNKEMLYIVDGRKCGIQELIDKVESDIPLTDEENKLINNILDAQIDCVSYDSRARNGGENYIFLERGFKKLFLRDVRLRFSKENGGSHKKIQCSVFSDYLPYLKSYAIYFLPKCKIKTDESYFESEEYLSREKNINEFRKNHNKINK